jgi:hypothetical protein
LNKIRSLAVTLLLLLPGSIFAKYMAVLETLSPKELLTTQERLFLTDILREQAVNILPAEQNWTIMTRENINVMLPPGKTIEECEGSCLAETGKNIAADYVAQARISQFGKSLAITAEVYETASSKLVASYVGKGESVEDIEKIIKEQSPAFFQKARDNALKGIGYVNTNYSFSFQGMQKFIVAITTNPANALPTFDGKANAQCTSTPCSVQLDAGRHRIIVSKERFEDLDTLIDITQNEQKINLNLVPNVGYINIEPQISDEFKNVGSATASINEKKANWGTNEVPPGLYSVRIHHSCHDPIELNVALQKDETKTISDTLKRGIGGLELSVTKKGVPQAVPVFIDGNDAGKTPFVGEVPLCAKIEIENSGKREQIPVDIKWHEIVKTTYEMKEIASAPTKADAARQKADVAYAELDGKKVSTATANDDEATSGTPKLLWGGATLGILYNDFHSSHFGLNNIKNETGYGLTVQGDDDLLNSFWGIGFKAGFGGLFIVSPYFGLHGELGLGFRQGTGKTNLMVTLSDNENVEKKSALEVEYSASQLNIDIPLLARVTIPKALYLEAGPMISFNVYSKSKSNITDTRGTQTYEEKGDLSAFEFDLAAGLGITRSIGKSILDFNLRMAFGMTRISDSKDAPKTWQGQFNATYWFL